jgi:hypothetical protein
MTQMISQALKRYPINERDVDFGHNVTFCKRYWGTEMKDYGPSRWPEADKFIKDHKSIWEEQARLSKAQGDAKGDTTEHDDSEGDRSSGKVENEADVLKSLQSVPSKNGQMKNSASNVDYHESCRLLYATPTPEGYTAIHDPILIRAEYPRIYDRLVFLHSKEVKAVITGQPGIGNPPLHRRTYLI